MVHYIDKDRIVAEIEKIIADETESIKSFEHGKNVSEVQRSNARIGILIHIRSLLDTLEVKELPIWEKVSPDTGQTILYKDGDKSYLERFGYRIDLKELDKLPKNNSTHRTPADIESAMQEVEAKSEAYTNAHRGERADDVLSQMQEEPISEDLEKAGKEWLRPQLDKSYANYGEAKMMELTHFDGYAMLEAIEFGAKWKEEQIMKNAVECEYFDGSLFCNDLREKYRDCDKVKIVIVIKED